LKVGTYIEPRPSQAINIAVSHCFAADARPSSVTASSLKKHGMRQHADASVGFEKLTQRASANRNAPDTTMADVEN